MKKIYIIWLISIGILPMFQGGYFYHEGLFFGVAQGIVLLFIISQKKATIKFTSFRWMYLLIIISSLLSSLTSIDKGMHVVGVLKLLVPFIFIINLDSFYSLYKEKCIKDLKTVFVGLVSVMALIVIVIVLIGDIDMSMFKHFVQGTRIGGFFQYANTFAIYLYAGLMLLFSLSIVNKLKLPLSIVLITCIYLTQSRGVFIILMLSLLLLIVMNVNKLRWLYILSIIGVGFGQSILWWIQDHVDVFRGVLVTDNTSEWLSRFLYYEDSISMLLKRLTGYGHLGYYYSQQFFQTGASYKVKYLHNSLLQIAVDYGIIAGIGLLLISIYSLTMMYRVYIIKKMKVQENDLILFITSLGLFAHNLIDFDFQFTAFVIVYIAIIWILEQNWCVIVKERELKFKLLSRYGLNLIRNFSFIALLVLVIGFGYIGVVTNLDYELESIKAYKMYPYYTDSVDKILKSTKMQNALSKNDTVEIAKLTTSRNEFYLNGFAFLRDYYYNSGDLENAIENAQKVYELAPLRLDYYEIYSKITIEYVLGLYKRNQLTKDNAYLQGLINMDTYINELEKERKNTYNIKHQVEFVLSENMLKILEKAKALYNTI